MILERHPTWSYPDLEATPLGVLQAEAALREARAKVSSRE